MKVLAEVQMDAELTLILSVSVAAVLWSADNWNSGRHLGASHGMNQMAEIN